MAGEPATADGQRFTEAMARGVVTVERLLDRIHRPSLHSPGASHIDQILRDCVERRLPGEHTARRLMVAADIADVLDKGSAA